MCGLPAATRPRSIYPRMSLEVVEARLLEVNGELTRLRSQEGELNARLRELRGSKTK